MRENSLKFNRRFRGLRFRGFGRRVKLPIDISDTLIDRRVGHQIGRDLIGIIPLLGAHRF